MSGVDASIVIPVWNGRPYLDACLKALLAHAAGEGRAEILLVDNASTDGSADYVEANYSQVRLIRNRDNRGFSGACNAGLQAASGQVLVLLNQDTRVYPGWLDALSGALRNPRVGVVGCKALYPDGETIQHAGGRVDWPLALVAHDGAGERDEGQWDQPRAVEYVTGAAMAFRREMLDEIGALDEGFWPGYYEDTDFCFRAREAGYEVWYIPDAAMVHVETGSLASTGQLSSFFHQGRLRFVLKHLPPESFLQEFVPAEERELLSSAQGETALALRMAYLKAIPSVPYLYSRRWQADLDMVSGVLHALQQLYLYPIAGPEATSIQPSLAELDFRSSIPVVGSLLSKARSLWYSVAARWAVRYLAQQQEAFNWQIKAIQVRQEAVNELHVRSLVSLSEEVARLVSVETQSQRPDAESGGR